MCRGHDFGTSQRSSDNIGCKSEDSWSGNEITLAHQGERFKLSQRHIYVEAEPPDWDYMEALRYCMSLSSGLLLFIFSPGSLNVIVDLDHAIVRPTLPSVQNPQIGSEEKLPAFFIGSMISMQLTRISNSVGRILRPGEDPALARLWSKYSRYLLELVEIVNLCMRGGKYRGRDLSLSGIFCLMLLDVGTNSTMWISHMRGGLAFVQHCGGVDALRHRPGGLPVWLTRLLS